MVNILARLPLVVHPVDVTVLCGGLGGARLAMAAVDAGVAHRWRFVTNVADDTTVGSLLVCPDTDAVLYALAGRFDDERGWGVKDDRFPPPEPGEPTWFHLGDRDRRLHAERRRLLVRGPGVGAATAALARWLGVPAVVRPVTDDRVHTRVRVDGVWRGFQEWLVRDHAPPAEAVSYRGIGAARPAPSALAAIRESRVCVLAPSSPVASLDPILSVPGLRATLRTRRGPTVLISPVVDRRRLLTDRDRHRARARNRLLAAVGCDGGVVAVADRYRADVDVLVLDPADAADRAACEALGLSVVVAPTIGDGWRARHEQVRVIRNLAGGDRARVTAAGPLDASGLP